VSLLYSAVRKAAHSNAQKARTPPRAPTASRRVSAPLRTAQTVRPCPSPGDLAQLRQWAAEQVPVDRPEAPTPQTPLSAEAHASETEATQSDRPRSMGEMIGQEALRRQLEMVMYGAQQRGVKPAHVLLTGPSGHGKTTLAGVIANSLGGTLVSTNGMLLRKAADLVGLLIKMPPNSILFIDEVHSLPAPVSEVLYEVLEDGKLTALMGSGAETTSITHQMQGFVCVAATTRPGLLSVPFRGRFGFVGQVQPYTEDELAEMVASAWDRKGVLYGSDEPGEVACRAKGVPRRALHLSERTLDWCSVMGSDGVVEPGTVARAMAAFDIDARGMDGNDWLVIEALCGRFAGRTVGADALASAINLDLRSLTDEVEPWLCQAGYVQRTKTGRLALEPAYELVREKEGNR